MVNGCMTDTRTILVCVDDCVSGEARGRVYNSGLTKEDSFSSLYQLLMSIEQTLEQLDFPKAYTVTRSFADNMPEAESELPDELCCAPDGSQWHKGELASFSLRILFRQNSSWQGSITWLETNQEQSFRSALELIFLMYSAMVNSNQ